MALPFALGLLGVVVAMAGRRGAAIWIWSALIIVLLVWLRYHATDVLAISL